VNRRGLKAFRSGESRPRRIRSVSAAAVPGATGHGMLGVTLAPGTAAALTDLILRGRLSPDLNTFSPRRFTGYHRHRGKALAA